MTDPDDDLNENLAGLREEMRQVLARIDERTRRERRRDRRLSWALAVTQVGLVGLGVLFWRDVRDDAAEDCATALRIRADQEEAWVGIAEGLGAEPGGEALTTITDFYDGLPPPADCT